MTPATGASPLTIRRILLDDDTVLLEAEGAVVRAICPSCGTVAERVHDRYQRRPLDLPWRGVRVRLLLTVRRFRCEHPPCKRATFVEDFGTVLPRRAQRTPQANALLVQFAGVNGGEAGARLARAAGLPVSADTLLRLLRQRELPNSGTPRVLGVDDLALRRGCSYATLFVDLETREPIDLVRGRDATVLADWLREHPGVEIIVRDRSEAYARGAREAAPEAQQVADRFHLVQNASAALDEVLRGRRRQVEITSERAEAEAPPQTNEPQRPPSPTKQRQAARRAARVRRWERVRELHARGVSICAIARVVEIDRKTVRRLLGTEEPPRNRIERPRLGGLRSPRLQPYVAHLRERWEQGCHNASQLYRELVAQGYTGSRSLLAQALQPWRPPRPPRGERRQRQRRSVRWLCLRPPDQLTVAERAALEQLLTADADLARGYQLLQQFRTVVTQRDVAGLEGWLAAARASELPSFIGLANGIVADRLAVEAALTTPWSNGPVEGQIHRVKLIKRQGYGRAKLDLLRRRVLAA